MRYLRTIVLVAALAAPSAALAAGTTTSPGNASCKAQQTALGAVVFKSTYGNQSNAFGKCVVKANAANQLAAANAAKTCKAQQADTNFANAATNPNHLTFNAFYGANGKGKSADANAYGKCVSTTTSQSDAHTTAAIISAAKACKALGKAALATTYGSTKHAFGDCVSKTTKTT